MQKKKQQANIVKPV